MEIVEFGWKRGRVYCEYRPKEGYSPGDVIVHRELDDAFELIVDEGLRITASQEKIREIVEFINSIQYPDVHIVKRACSLVKIQDGRVVEMGEPKLLYCPLAKERYGRPRCEECHEVKPFLQKRI